MFIAWSYVKISHKWTNLFYYIQPWLNGILVISTSAFIDIPAVIFGLAFGNRLEIFWTENFPLRSTNLVDFWRRCGASLIFGSV